VTHTMPRPETLAGLQAEGAFYVFDIPALAARVAQLRAALPSGAALCYAVKANPFIARAVAPLTDRFEICSPGEWAICKAAGLPGEKAVISGVYKPEAFIDALVGDPGFAGTLTVESLLQFTQIARAAEAAGRRVPMLLRLTNGSQFGLDEADAEALIADREAHPSVDIAGIQYFSGTQKTSVKKLRRELMALDDFIARARDAHGYDARILEYGPGLPAATFEEDAFDPDAVLEGLTAALSELRYTGALALELGRGIAAGCGRYFTHVVDVKRCQGQNYAVTDGGLHQLTYFGQFMGMKHPRFTLVNRADEPADEVWNLCGALCSMNDILVKQASLPRLRVGDTLCFENAGAYCVTEGMSLFLSRDLPAIYLREMDGTIRRVRDNFETAALNTPDYERK